MTTFDLPPPPRGRQAVVVTPPAEYLGSFPTLFLAGGITGCPDWQAEVCHRLVDTGLILLNPRRPDFPVDDPSAAAAQIRWEFEHLGRATARLFWFPAQTVCPIALYELGRWAALAPGQPLFVGTAPGYPRRLDVLEQLNLARPDVRVTSHLDDLEFAVRVAFNRHHS